MNKPAKQIVITVIAVIVVFGSAVYINRVKIGEMVFELQKKNLPKAESYDTATKKIGFVDGQVQTIDIIPLQADLQINQPASASVSLPDEINLDVPFMPQAPFGVWDALHEDACEEASVTMASHFVLKKSIPDMAYADAEIKKIIDWEYKNFGFSKDTNAEKTAEILQKLYGLKNTEVKYDATLDDVMSAVGRGYPVILPLYGRGLNPYFRGGGPLYHMLVVKGYTKHGQFITNDPGTKRGKDYVYDGAFLVDRIHDWNGGDVINGQKTIIIVKE